MKRLIIAAVILCSGTLAGAAEPIVALEIAMMPGAPITAPQEWAKRLGKLGLSRVQIRSMHGEEKPVTEMNDEGTRLDVLAVLTRQGELVFADRKFRAQQSSDLAEYLKNLPAQVVEAGIVRGPFQLTEQEFQHVMNELAKPLTGSTVGSTTRDLLAEAATKIRLPMETTTAAEARLRNGGPLTVELDKLSLGTALAIALRGDGLAMRPQHVGQGLQLVIEPYERDREVWPTGWQAQQTPRQFVPQLFESLSIEVEGYTLASALEALAPRLGVPAVMDHWTLEQLAIEPAKIPVKLPAKKTFLKNAVDKLASQARLACEIRIDEAGNAFLWFTQFGPDSRPAR